MIHSLHNRLTLEILTILPDIPPDKLEELVTAVEWYTKGVPLMDCPATEMASP